MAYKIKNKPVKEIKFETTNPYSKEIIKKKIPEKRNFNGKSYEVMEIFANWGYMQPSGHSQAKGYAKQLNSQGIKTKIIANSGYTIIYGYYKNNK
jgi:hypothetical protein